MKIHPFPSLIVIAGILFLVPPAAGNGGPAQTGKGHHAGGEDAMKTQHERMAQFGKAAQAILDAIIHSAPKIAGEAADLLEKSLAGHEKDVPHKNLPREKEFHGLYVELGKRTNNLKEAVRKKDMPKAAAAYGRILEVCATCHERFRD